MQGSNDNSNEECVKAITFFTGFLAGTEDDVKIMEFPADFDAGQYPWKDLETVALG